MTGAVELGVADHRKYTGHEQAGADSDHSMPMLPSLSRPPLDCCLGTNPIQAEKLRPDGIR